MINPANDRVELYRAGDGDYRWRRIDGSNGQVVAAATEGYESLAYAREAAQAYNAGVPVVELDHDEDQAR